MVAFLSAVCYDKTLKGYNYEKTRLYFDWMHTFGSSSVCGIFLLTGKEAQEAVVTVDGEVYGTYSLAKDQTIEIQDGNRLRIQNGQAKMEWADCPDQLCVHQKAISRTGESIICLPNQVVVSVQGSKESELDGIVN
ncbi:hypothetical protein HMPREF0991_01484 [Lachnospiraceae bacterium 2_1_58FAA]|uniref:NusG domain II-containing protein n=1 Tax=Mediterraneibacter gnavus TaxID=33038 RepID=UPI000213575F|nr:NusG domain II-containing protein [Mediterraneibacter gnavus]EGN48604.1 hypothetical protein HMPREF0991_01484 [Lachnospiraceae bacterium 2_1_58FAA]